MRSIGETRNRWRSLLITILVASYILLFLIYARVHFAVISDPLPVTLRETAFIAHSDAMLDSNPPPFYSWETPPGLVNLYGPGYTFASLPFAYLFYETPYFSHRIAVGLFLAVSCLIIGYTIRNSSGLRYGFVGAVFFYVTTVASPSTAAGPDTLATLFYITAIAILHLRGFGRSSLLISSALGLLALLTKPYAVLVIPGMLCYCYLFVSPKRALIATISTVAVCLFGGLTISYLMPSYFHTTFGIHAHHTTRFFEQLMLQTWEFSYLHFALLIIMALGFPFRRLIGISLLTFSDLVGKEPLFTRPIGFSNFMVITAMITLLLVLGWHGGAYLIYFNHLLLPPILISALCNTELLSKYFKCSSVFLTCNALLLIFIVPSMPKGEPFPKEIGELLEGKAVLIDPILLNLTRILPTAHLVDNGQTEYLVNYDLLNDSPSRSNTQKWLVEETAKIKKGEYEYLLLLRTYNRPYLLSQGEQTEVLRSQYEILGYVDINIYYKSFRLRDKFGHREVPLLIFYRKDT